MNVFAYRFLFIRIFWAISWAIFAISRSSDLVIGELE